MKITKISLAGNIIQIREDAYPMLENYLKQLKAHYQKTDDNAEDIIEDIESRILEFFNEQLANGKEVMTITDVKTIIAKIGTVDAIKDEEPKPLGSKAPRVKRIFRSETDSILFGVAGGLSEYFQIDPVITRILIVFLTLITSGLVLIAYVVLAILLPKKSLVKNSQDQDSIEAYNKNSRKGLIILALICGGIALLQILAFLIPQLFWLQHGNFNIF